MPIDSFEERVLRETNRLKSQIERLNRFDIPAGSATGTRATFTHADLVAGILTVTHALGLLAPYSLVVTITDNNNNIIIPTSIIFLTNTFTVDLLFADDLYDIAGNWGVYYI